MAAKRIDVPEAIAAMIQRTRPAAAIRGMDADETRPETVSSDGAALIGSGDPGTPEIDLSPAVYRAGHACSAAGSRWRASAVRARALAC